MAPESLQGKIRWSPAPGAPRVWDGHGARLMVEGGEPLPLEQMVGIAPKDPYPPAPGAERYWRQLGYLR